MALVMLVMKAMEKVEEDVTMTTTFPGCAPTAVPTIALRAA
jgi:hypothetical protein